MFLGTHLTSDPLKMCSFIRDISKKEELFRYAKRKKAVLLEFILSTEKRKTNISKRSGRFPQPV